MLLFKGRTMNFRNWPIAKQIGALAFILSLCVFSIVGASSYFSAKTILTNKSEHTIKANLNQISSLLELQYNSLLAIARRNANVFSDMYSGSITLSEQKTQVGQYQVPSLAHNGELINNNMNMVDRYADLTKGNATVFVRDGDDFFRIATSLKKDNGERAVGTYLGNKHPGYEKLIAGEEYEGYAKLFGNEYMTVYKPIKNSTNRVIGILYIGFNINDSLNALRESVASLTIEESGKLLLFNNANNTIIVGPHSQSGEQLTKQTLQGLPIEQTDSNEHVYYTDQHNEAMFALAKKVKGWNWTLLARVKAHELNDESWQLMRVNALASIAGVIMISLLLFWGLVRTLAPLKRLTKTVDALGKGDLLQHIEATNQPSDNEVITITASVSKMSVELKKLILALQTSIVQLETQASAAHHLAQQNGQEAHEMMAQTAQIATAIEQMSCSIKDVAHNATEGANQTLQVDKDAQSGQSQLTQVINDLMLLSQQLNNSHDAVEKVNDASNEISKVTEVINAIAEQTNLLALNAAIEAARAGEQGRGFAVVADEVRTLAQRTQKSIVEISQTIEQLQSQVTMATQKMKQSQQLGLKSSEEGKKTGEQLESITISIGELTRSSSNIAEATDQQSTVAQEITQNLHQISQLAKDSEARTQGTISSADDLKTLAEGLKRQVSFFKAD